MFSDFQRRTLLFCDSTTSSLMSVLLAVANVSDVLAVKCEMFTNAEKNVKVKILKH